MPYILGGIVFAILFALNTCWLVLGENNWVSGPIHLATLTVIVLNLMLHRNTSEFRIVFFTCLLLLVFNNCYRITRIIDPSLRDFEQVRSNWVALFSAVDLFCVLTIVIISIPFRLFGSISHESREFLNLKSKRPSLQTLFCLTTSIAILLAIILKLWPSTEPDFNLMKPYALRIFWNRGVLMLLVLPILLSGYFVMKNSYSRFGMCVLAILISAVTGLHGLGLDFGLQAYLFPIVYSALVGALLYSGRLLPRSPRRLLTKVELRVP